MIVFTDLSISGGRYNGTDLPLAQGLQSCRTTRLHWLQTGLTQNPDGTLTSNTTALAPYGTPNLPNPNSPNQLTSPPRRLHAHPKRHPAHFHLLPLPAAGRLLAAGLGRRTQLHGAGRAGPPEFQRHGDFGRGRRAGRGELLSHFQSLEYGYGVV